MIEHLENRLYSLRYLKVKINGIRPWKQIVFPVLSDKSLAQTHIISLTTVIKLNTSVVLVSPYWI